MAEMRCCVLNKCYLSQRLRFRLLDEGDKGQYIALYQSPKVMRNIAPPLSDEDVETAFTTTLKLNKAKGIKQKVWAVHERQDNGFCGIGMAKWKNQSDDVELGLMLVPECNGKDFGTEAVGKIIDIVQADYHITDFQANFQSHHRPVRKILTNLGFAFEEPEIIGGQKMVKAILRDTESQSHKRRILNISAPIG